MSDEPASQPPESSVNYTDEDIELYYHFWVVHDGVSWHKTLKKEMKTTASSTSLSKSISPLTAALLGTCFLLSLWGLINWHYQAQFLEPKMTHNFTAELPRK